VALHALHADCCHLGQVRLKTVACHMSTSAYCAVYGGDGAGTMCVTQKAGQHRYRMNRNGRNQNPGFAARAHTCTIMHKHASHRATRHTATHITDTTTAHTCEQHKQLGHPERQLCVLQLRCVCTPASKTAVGTESDALPIAV
jgi:hypothetical protein